VKGVSATSNYLVATVRPWNIRAYNEHIGTLPGKWHLVTQREELTPVLIDALKPRYIFFPHWSWIVSPAILSRAECVCFHMTDVPYGRGGSPLQNLIVRGHKETKLTALRMTEELDAGPVYLKQSLSLAGSAQAIFERTGNLVYHMIRTIVDEEPTPIAQTGTVLHFERRTPAMSTLPPEGSLETVYDHIRMLDADTYPAAFLMHGRFIIRFSHAEIDAEGKAVKAHVTIEKTNERRT
jgi:methionyl-tRNA formyltransferase